MTALLRAGRALGCAGRVRALVLALRTDGKGGMPHVHTRTVRQHGARGTGHGHGQRQRLKINASTPSRSTEHGAPAGPSPPSYATPSLQPHPNHGRPQRKPQRGSPPTPTAWHCTSTRTLLQVVQVVSSLVLWLSSPPAHFCAAPQLVGVRHKRNGRSGPLLL